MQVATIMRGMTGTKSGVDAAVAAIRALKMVQAGEPLTEEGRAAIAAWRGWGPLTTLFDGRHDYYETVKEGKLALQDVLVESEFETAKRATLNAYYTPGWLIEHIWRIVGAAGFTGGRVIEAGCGAGRFFAHAPDGCDLYGIEVDHLSALAASINFPHAEIVRERFENVEIGSETFDIAVGNVPFGKDKPYDPIDNADKLSIHNYFLLKLLRTVRVGGLVAVITSRFTLDAGNPKSRDSISRYGELVAALRLPNGTFSQEGTDTAADLLVFRRTEAKIEATADPTWRNAVQVPFPLRGYKRRGESTHYLRNAVFGSHGIIVGEADRSYGMYSGDDVKIHVIDGTIVDAVAAVIPTIVKTVEGSYTPRSADGVDAPVLVSTKDRVLPGTIRVNNGGGGFERYYASTRSWCQHDPGKDGAELRRLIGLRDAAIAVLRGRTGVDVSDLNRSYDEYLSAHGPLNRRGGSEFRPRFPSMGGFRDDPSWPMVAALEMADGSKAAVFGGSSISALSDINVETISDAVAVCLNELGSLDMDRMADLLGRRVETELVESGTAFDDPVSGRWMCADEFCSGDVRARLEAAQHRVSSDSRFEAHVAALESVLPDDATPETITARLGATWIPAEVVRLFLVELGKIQSVEVEHVAGISAWKVSVPGYTVSGRASRLTIDQWGTQDLDMFELVDRALNGLTPKVTTVGYRPDGSEYRVVDPVATEAATAKLAEIQDRFADWVWEDPDRSAALLDDYNKRFRSIRLRSYDGSHQTFPGLSASFTPHGHQKDAVWRLVSSGGGLVGHQVGAGKTAVGIISAMEMRRLGLVRKPMFVVPNHMLEQFSADFLRLYPAAKVLSAGRHETSRSERAELVAAAAFGEWDAIVLTHSAFGRIPMSDDAAAAYIGRELAEMEAALGEALDDNRSKSMVKRIERRKAALESKLQALTDKERDPSAVWFEDMGVDYLVVDESQAFKNLSITTSSDAPVASPSKQATDLDMKIEHTRATSGSPRRVVSFLTGTPVSNTISELWTVSHYLAPHVLRRAGLESFDDWLRTFADVVTELEMNPTGVGWRMHSRIARFRNVGDLRTIFHEFADILTSDELDIVVPERRFEIAAADMTPEMEAVMDHIVERVDRIKARMVTPDEDNYLSVASTARMASLDTRLVGFGKPSDGGKIRLCADRVTELAAAHPDGLQIVFCDLGTPNSTRFSVYHELADLLVERGMGRTEIEFVQDAKSERAKESLFARCRRGPIRVVIGSSSTFGEGTNVQDRAVAIHHLDAPWRPSDIEQREGRAIRQGNPATSVNVVRYVTEGSFDTFMWQTLERKARFISQIMAPEGDIGESIDDIDSANTFSYAEVKAVAAGDPAVMRREIVKDEIAKMTRSHTAWVRSCRAAANMVSDLKWQINKANAEAKHIAWVADFDIDHATIKAKYREDSLFDIDWATSSPQVDVVCGDTTLSLKFTRWGTNKLRAYVNNGSSPIGEIRIRSTEAYVGMSDNPDAAIRLCIGRHISEMASKQSDVDRSIAGLSDRISEFEAVVASQWTRGPELDALRRELAEIDERLEGHLVEEPENLAA